MEGVGVWNVWTCKPAQASYLPPYFSSNTQIAVRFVSLTFVRPPHFHTSVYPCSCALNTSVSPNSHTQVVYDPSVLVRCELAVLYARFVRGHAAFVQEALASQSRRLLDFLHTHRQAEAVAAAAAASSRGGGGGYGGSGGDGSAGSGGSGERGAGADGYGISSGNSPQTGAPPTLTQPAGAMATAGSGTADAQPPPAGSAPSSQYQSPTTYSALLDSIQMLALDPSPRVAKMGRDVLRIA
eukprot:154981-Chlamydomonas_euryale.AAC.2